MRSSHLVFLLNVTCLRISETSQVPRTTLRQFHRKDIHAISPGAIATKLQLHLDGRFDCTEVDCEVGATVHKVHSKPKPAERELFDHAGLIAAVADGLEQDHSEPDSMAVVKRNSEEYHNGDDVTDARKQNAKYGMWDKLPTVHLEREVVVAPSSQSSHRGEATPDDEVVKQLLEFEMASEGEEAVTDKHVNDSVGAPAIQAAEEEAESEDVDEIVSASDLQVAEAELESVIGDVFTSTPAKQVAEEEAELEPLDQAATVSAAQEPEDGNLDESVGNVSAAEEAQSDHVERTASLPVKQDAQPEPADHPEMGAHPKTKVRHPDAALVQVDAATLQTQENKILAEIHSENKKIDAMIDMLNQSILQPPSRGGAAEAVAPRSPIMLSGGFQGAATRSSFFASPVALVVIITIPVVLLTFVSIFRLSDGERWEEPQEATSTGMGCMGSRWSRSNGKDANASGWTARPSITPSGYDVPLTRASSIISIPASAWPEGSASQLTPRGTRSEACTRLPTQAQISMLPETGPSKPPTLDFRKLAETGDKAMQPAAQSHRQKQTTWSARTGSAAPTFRAPVVPRLDFNSSSGSRTPLWTRPSARERVESGNTSALSTATLS